LAIECAKRNMNLVLVSLPGPELKDLVEMIREKYMVEVVAIEIDLCIDNSCSFVYNEIQDMGLRVNMVINNAGVGSTGSFAEGNIHLYERQIKLNVLATTLITRLFLNMLKQNGPSYILNVGSLASLFPLPKKQVYGATKSFIYYFSKCLRAEGWRDKVYVSLICPGPMKTNQAVQTVINNGNFFIRNCSMDPDEVAVIAINGLLNRKALMLPGKLNKCYIIVYSILPDFIKSFITNRSMKRLSSSAFENNIIAKPVSG